MLTPIDSAVLRDLKRGKVSAFNILVATFESPLFRFFYCRDGNWHLAEELTAETFAQLVTSLSSMRGGTEQLRAYVFSVARHVRSRYLRQSPPQHASIESNIESNIELSWSGETPYDNLTQAETVKQLLRAVSQLDANVRTIILLRFVEGFSIGEIAESLDFPTGTIKSHLHRGKCRLKELLQEMGCE
ncbi:ECF RNA polymerase sigma factor SigW [Gimesia maris]|uniref:RNA polymerase sigma factor n=1 Tax=Gimesia maris TaxID=122 RepID=UPI0011884338|nr:RNA polymerase sigma factor [Gimesia maris]QDU13281.1 ECF RNA polymerase sigma factor SigW [Gimesia maris]